jgi:hypothetical protein
MAGRPEAEAVAGWYSLIIDLSSPSVGHRVTMATLDGDLLLSGSDMVYRMTPEANLMESLGGRFEPDGSFRGTHWYCVLEPGAEEHAQPGNFPPRKPSAGEARALRALLDELCRRHPLT